MAEFVDFLANLPWPMERTIVRPDKDRLLF